MWAFQQSCSTSTRMHKARGHSNSYSIEKAKQYTMLSTCNLALQWYSLAKATQYHACLKAHYHIECIQSWEGVLCGRLRGPKRPLPNLVLWGRLTSGGKTVKSFKTCFLWCRFSLLSPAAVRQLLAVKICKMYDQACGTVFPVLPCW